VGSNWQAVLVFFFPHDTFRLQAVGSTVRAADVCWLRVHWTTTAAFARVTKTSE